MRILLGADVEEVKKALDHLGLEIPEPTPPAEPGNAFIATLKELFDDVFGPYFLIRQLTSDFLDLIFGPQGPLPPAINFLDVEIDRLNTVAHSLNDVISTVDNLIGSRISGGEMDAALLITVLRPLQALRQQLLNAISELDTLSGDLTGVSDEAQRFREQLALLEEEADAESKTLHDKIEKEVEEGPTTAVI